VARKPGSSPMSKSPTIDHEVIRELARLLEETGLTEIAIEQDGVAVRVARYTGSNAARARATESGISAPGVAATAPPLDPAQHPGLMTSPMVGTAYRAQEPGARPFVDVGSEVKAGDTVLIIEAMKTMNQIPAPRSGKVIQILIEDTHPVEYGQPLMIIE
jgi:acetyl-CoA carboxylase biotin carboxyl carrier protein